jgi:hypothetical protein
MSTKIPNRVLKAAKIIAKHYPHDNCQTIWQYGFTDTKEGATRRVYLGGKWVIKTGGSFVKEARYITKVRKINNVRRYFPFSKLVSRHVLIQERCDPDIDRFFDNSTPDESFYGIPPQLRRLCRDWHEYNIGWRKWGRGYTPVFIDTEPEYWTCSIPKI